MERASDHGTAAVLAGEGATVAFSRGGDEGREGQGGAVASSPNIIAVIAPPAAAPPAVALGAATLAGAGLLFEGDGPGVVHPSSGRRPQLHEGVATAGSSGRGGGGAAGAAAAAAVTAAAATLYGVSSSAGLRGLGAPGAPPPPPPLLPPWPFACSRAGPQVSAQQPAPGAQVKWGGRGPTVQPKNSTWSTGIWEAAGKEARKAHAAAMQSALPARGSHRGPRTQAEIYAAAHLAHPAGRMDRFLFAPPPQGPGAGEASREEEEGGMAMEEEEDGGPVEGGHASGPAGVAAAAAAAYPPVSAPPAAPRCVPLPSTPSFLILNYISFSNYNHVTVRCHAFPPQNQGSSFHRGRAYS